MAQRDIFVFCICPRRQAHPCSYPIRCYLDRHCDVDPECRHALERYKNESISHNFQCLLPSTTLTSQPLRLPSTKHTTASKMHALTALVSLSAVASAAVLPRADSQSFKLKTQLKSTSADKTEFANQYLYV